MSEIHDAKASFSFLPVILGVGGLAGGVALTGVAARLLKNNAIWWAALPAGLVGYGAGHLAGKTIVVVKHGHRGQQPQEQTSEDAGRLDDLTADLDRWQRRLGQPVGRSPSKSYEQRQKKREGRRAKRRLEYKARRAAFDVKLEAKRAERKQELEAKRAERQQELEAMQADYQKKRDTLDDTYAKLQQQVQDQRDAVLKTIKDSEDREAPDRLILAASLGKYDEAKQALENRRLDPSAVVGSQTALHCAVRKNDLEMVKLLLPYCEDVNRVCEGEKPIQKAIWKDSPDMCRLLLDNGAVLSDADTGSLYTAVLWEDSATLEAIVDCFTNMDDTNAKGETAAKRAARDGKVTHLNVLLARGASLQKSDFSAKEWEKLSPEIQKLIPNVTNIRAQLQRAIDAGDQATVTRLLNGEGIVLNAPLAEDGSTLLHYAVKQPIQHAIAHLLIDHGADIEAVDDAGKTPIQWLKELAESSPPEAPTYEDAKQQVPAPNLELLKQRHIGEYTLPELDWSLVGSLERVVDTHYFRNQQALDDFIAKDLRTVQQQYLAQVDETLRELTQRYENEIDVYFQEREKAQRLLSDLGISFSPSLESID